MPAHIDFKALAESIDIEQVATLLGLHLKRGKDIRSACPACGGDERGIQIFPETNSFRCYRAEVSGDVIALYAHVKSYQGMYKAAKELAEQFQNGSVTVPQKPEGRTAAKAAQPAPFDSDVFKTKLAFTDEVSALGFTEEIAARFAIGFYRGRVYIPVRDADGSISGFIGYADGQLKIPPQWLPPRNVVRFPKSA